MMRTRREGDFGKQQLAERTLDFFLNPRHLIFLLNWSSPSKKLNISMYFISSIICTSSHKSLRFPRRKFKPFYFVLKSRILSKKNLSDINVFPKAWWEVWNPPRGCQGRWSEKWRTLFMGFGIKPIRAACLVQWSTCSLALGRLLNLPAPPWFISKRR